MKRQLFTNLILVVGLFFTLAFACGENNRSSKSTSTENQDEEAISQKENLDEETISQTEDQDVQGPRLGKYTILSYGDVKYPPLHLGHFELLSGGRYKSYSPGGKISGEGKYSFDAETSIVKFLSGKFNDDGWGGEFTNEGGASKAHNIRLHGRGTFGTNSLDNP